MKQRKSAKSALVVAILMILLGAVANAETTFHADTPANKITAREAAKRMKADKETFKCRAVKLGPNINPVVEPKAPTTWHTAISADIGERAIDLLTENKRVVKCESVYLDSDTARVRKVQ